MERTLWDPDPAVVHPPELAIAILSQLQLQSQLVLEEPQLCVLLPEVALVPVLLPPLLGAFFLPPPPLFFDFGFGIVC